MMNDARLVFVLYVVAVYLIQIMPLGLNGMRVVNERSQKSGNRKRLPQLFGYAFNVDAPDFVQLVSRHGYPAEVHKVITADGYKLRIHRIPGSPDRPKVDGKPVVYIQHGLLASSDSWVLFGPERDLAFMMADAGFDVWLGNIRGSTYSRSHETLSPDYDVEYWQFSWHEMAIYDVPAVIDYILDQTGEKDLVYIGHSMGTTISYVLLSMKPEYNDKIWLVISLAPIALWKAPPSNILRLLKDNGDRIKTIIYTTGIYEILPRTKETIRLLTTMCGHKSPLQSMCLDVLWTAAGYNPDQLNMSVIPSLFSFFPAGSSRQTLEHYSQNIATGDFQMFDHGRENNLVKYGQAEPPSYNLNNIRTPVALYYGENDALAPPGNPILLAERLPNVAVLHRVADDLFNHMDFILANDVKSLLNEPIMDMVFKSLEARKGQ